MNELILFNNFVLQDDSFAIHETGHRRESSQGDSCQGCLCYFAPSIKTLQDQSHLPV